MGKDNAKANKMVMKPSDPIPVREKSPWLKGFFGSGWFAASFGMQLIPAGIDHAVIQMK
ncbi:hypothetical protein [Laceyella sediminis]|uniref:hypothetical protein n=1 Tax=Laceyella sediminis TaxID=573074 RepID=UPI0015E6FEA6|nr:hypothetical protein [Laceyella sediminis]